MDEFEAYWPSWPNGVQGENLTDVYVGCGFDHLVELLWGRVSQFQLDFNSEVGFIDFQRTEWLDDHNDLPCLPGGFDWTVEDTASQDQQVVVDYSNKLRKVRSHNGGGAAFLGQFFKTEELQRCQEFVAGEKLVMEACVCTTAPFCDRFRVICQYDMQSVREDACRLKIDFHIAYVQKVNGMTKVFMEKGARGGLIKNFEIYVQTLSKFVSLLSPEQVEAIREHAPVASPSTDPLQELPGRESELQERSTFIRWEGFACPPFRKLLAPKLEQARATIFEKPPSPSFLTPLLSTACMSQLLCILAFMVVVKFVLMILGGLSHAMGLTCSRNVVLNLTLRVFDLPDSVGEVLTAAVVLEVVHWVLTTVGDLATDPSREGILSQEEHSSAPSSSSLKDRSMESQSHVAADGASSSSQGSTDSKGAELGSNPAPSTSAPLSHESLAENGEAGSSRDSDSRGQETETDFVEPPPSFIENTVSFFRLGIVASALAVDIAISGMTKRNEDSSEAENDGLAQEEDPVAASLPKENPSIVVEGIFENERLQPFRGWGHTWPGHFLPTDKCSHWSVQTLNGDSDPLTSMNFEDIECELPDGWTWDDAEWKIDLSGRETEAVDRDGWQYGVDFGWLKFPPEPGNGKRSGKFIRRRRWMRSRSKLPEADAPSPRAMDDRFSTGLMNSISAGEGQGKMAETTSRVLARLSFDSSKAMSETSYFAGNPIVSSARADLMAREENFNAAPTETMHRRHSSGATTMERFFSVEECFAALVQSFGESVDDLDQANKAGHTGLDPKAGRVDNNGERDPGSSPAMCDDQAAVAAAWIAASKSCPEAFLQAENGKRKEWNSVDLGEVHMNPVTRSADNLGNLKFVGTGAEEDEEGCKAWSDSEITTPRRVKDSGFGRLLIPSFQFREKIVDCGTRVNMAFHDSAVCRRRKRQAQPQKVDGASRKISEPLRIDATEDTCWLSMEGGKWVEKCLTPKTSPSTSQSLESVVPKMHSD